jgi:glycosyltransferase involved in cell wall biosynthesis
VDIMTTLHHGLLVDPTNSKQIADALLKILTNPEVWDEMSHNGEPPPPSPLPANAGWERMVCRKHTVALCVMCM